MNIYQERAALIAFLTKIYPAVFAYNDPDEPDWPVIYITTTEGQLSWHIAEDDMYLFPETPVTPPGNAPWDGHSTEEKYARLARLNPLNDMAPTA